MSDKILNITNLSKKYEYGVQGSRDVFQDISLDVKMGEWITIGGPSGSGKTTLLKIICKKLNPNEGSINYLNELKINEIAYVPQEPVLFPYLTVLENMIDVNRNKQIIESNLKLFGLTELKDSYPDELSGGELIRASFARSLISKPKLILIDEPTANLDLINVSKIIEILKIINSEGITQIVVSHSSEVLSTGLRKFEIKNLKLKELTDIPELANSIV